MGSYRSEARRRETDTARLRHEDRPKGVPEDQWLGPNEEIIYWARLPHAAALAIFGASTEAQLASRRSRDVAAVVRAERANLATLLYGIVDWTVRDENDQLVPWDPPRIDEPDWFERGSRLVSGLPRPVIMALLERIDSGSPDEPGNASGAS